MLGSYIAPVWEAAARCLCKPPHQVAKNTFQTKHFCHHCPQLCHHFDWFSHLWFCWSWVMANLYKSQSNLTCLFDSWVLSWQWGQAYKASLTLFHTPGKAKPPEIGVLWNIARIWNPLLLTVNCSLDSKSKVTPGDSKRICIELYIFPKSCIFTLLSSNPKPNLGNARIVRCHNSSASLLTS